MFDVNTVLTTAPECVALFEGDVRVVAVSDNGMSALMRLDVCPLRAPFNIATTDLVDGIQRESIIVLEEYDTGLPGSKDQISEAQQERLKVTSEFMKSIIGNQNLILDPELRAKELERVSKEFKVSVRTIRRIFYRYLWGGQTELSLVDRTSKRGSHEPQSNGTKRRGPKQSKNTKSEAVLPEIKERLEKGARLFYTRLNDGRQVPMFGWHYACRSFLYSPGESSIIEVVCRPECLYGQFWGRGLR